MRSIAIVLSIFLASCLPESFAIELFPIPNPDSDYVNGTTLMSLSGIGIGAPVTSLIQGSQTVSFNATLERSIVDPDTWSTWGSPPATESSNPLILIHNSVSPLEISLSLPSKTFGFELQGAEFIESPFTVRYFDALGEVGSIERLVNGDSGARLFAGYSQTRSFTRIVIDNPGGNSTGWAIANIRYATTAVPEPSTYALGIIASGTIGLIARRKRARFARKTH